MASRAEDAFIEWLMYFWYFSQWYSTEPSARAQKQPPAQSQPYQTVYSVHDVTGPDAAVPPDNDVM